MVDKTFPLYGRFDSANFAHKDESWLWNKRYGYLTMLFYILCIQEESDPDVVIIAKEEEEEEETELDVVIIVEVNPMLNATNMVVSSTSSMCGERRNPKLLLI